MRSFLESSQIKMEKRDLEYYITICKGVLCDAPNCGGLVPDNFEGYIVSDNFVMLGPSQHHLLTIPVIANLMCRMNDGTLRAKLETILENSVAISG